MKLASGGLRDVGGRRGRRVLLWRCLLLLLAVPRLQIRVLLLKRRAASQRQKHVLRVLRRLTHQLRVDRVPGSIRDVSLLADQGS